MRNPGWTFIIGLVVLVAGTAICGVFSFGLTRQFVIDFAAQGVEPSSPVELVNFVLRGASSVQPQNTTFEDTLVATPVPTLAVAAPTVEPTRSEAATSQPTEVTVSASSPEPTSDPLLDNPMLNDPFRKTILLLGIDQRDAINEPGPFRTDTMIVVSVDPVRKTAGVLSIPRDLWVTIPGFRAGRINTANALGDSSAFPGGGPALAAETVTANLGIQVDKYILVNFHVFTTLVDLIAPNGVEIDVKEEIDDPDYPDAGYGTIPVHFDPGKQMLNGERLLQYARTRATFGGDFDRARRQQEVLDALRAQVLSAGGVANFISQAPAIWEELKGSYRTNLTIEELIGLGLLMNEIPRENIEFGVIDNLYVDLSTSAEGDKVLIPRQKAISDLIQRVFNPQPNLTLADLRARAEAESASIVVYNNTDISGLAGQTREFLQSRDVAVVNVGNVPTPTNVDTIIRDYTGNPWTARYLAALLGLPLDRIQPGGDGLTSEDVMVVVGPDIQPLLSGGS